MLIGTRHSSIRSINECRGFDYRGLTKSDEHHRRLILQQGRRNFEVGDMRDIPFCTSPACCLGDGRASKFSSLRRVALWIGKSWYRCLAERLTPISRSKVRALQR